MLDVYLRGDVDRISPEAPVPVVRVRDWANVTPAFLETEWERLHIDTSLEWTKIYLPFWLDKLLHAVDGAEPHTTVEYKARYAVR